MQEQPKNWKLDARCRGLDPQEAMRIFFPARDPRRGKAAKKVTKRHLAVFDEAKKLCRRCPVKEICLNEAIEEEQRRPFGFRGGKNEEERYEIFMRRITKENHND